MKKKVGAKLKYGHPMKTMTIRVLDNKKFIAEIKAHLKNKLSNYLV